LNFPYERGTGALSPNAEWLGGYGSGKKKIERESMPLGKEELAIMVARGCATPGCDHKNHTGRNIFSSGLPS
jgi:hypothetical protein